MGKVSLLPFSRVFVWKWFEQCWPESKCSSLIMFFKLTMINSIHTDQNDIRREMWEKKGTLQRNVKKMKGNIYSLRKWINLSKRNWCKKIEKNFKKKYMRKKGKNDHKTPK